MRILKLSANQSTFRTVTFKRSGLSFVVGAKKTPSDTGRNRTKTYNGVGKSLMLELIHFCLGSNGNDALKKHLPEWIFELSIEVDGEQHLIRRSAGKPTEITLDSASIKLPKLREWLLAKSFEPVQGIQGLTFRSLISPFIRSGRAAYERFDRADSGDTINPYWALVRNAFLLGLDLRLAQTKYELRSRQTMLKKTMKQLESDPLFADLFAEDTAGIELTSLREEASRLERELREFKVAEDYRQIQNRADSLKRDVEAARRDLVKVENTINQLDRSLASKGDVPPALIERMYAEASVAFPDQVRRRIHEVLEFQHELQSRRIARLTDERQTLERRRIDLVQKASELGKEIENSIRYLGTHVALDEYLAVSQRLSEIQQQMARLEASSEQRARVDRELKTIRRDLATEAIRTDDYLQSAQSLIEEANSLFRKFTKLLYGNRPSGLSVTNDEGDTLTRYRIDAHISSDAAEGINEAKIFCYDMMIVLLRRWHSVQVLVHDSSLFQPIDHRQRWSMIQLADDTCRRHDIQYIATFNEHDIDSMRPTSTEEIAEFDRIFSENNVVMRLTDQSPKERLLGIEVDMNYHSSSKNSGADEVVSA